MVDLLKVFMPTFLKDMISTKNNRIFIKPKDELFCTAVKMKTNKFLKGSNSASCFYILEELSVVNHPPNYINSRTYSHLET